MLGTEDLDNVELGITHSHRIEDINKNIGSIFSLNNSQVRKFTNLKKENKSSGRKKYSAHYNKDLRKLVEHKERYIIEKFGYTFS